ncbi:MAG TPA: SRPBCC family protein [Bacteroidota bacterium]|nr:SRPBCC family protein [Bacteroidota bacterium]
MKAKRLYSITVDIAAPQERIWEVMSDVEHWHTWTPSVRKIRRLDRGPFTLDSKVLIYQPKLPPALWKATAFEEGRSFTWISRGPGIRVTAHHTIEPITGGSRVMLSVQYEGILAGMVSRLTASINDRYLGYEAEGLKKKCEEKHS